jgi:hypothetical protein
VIRGPGPEPNSGNKIDLVKSESDWPSDTKLGRKGRKRLNLAFLGGEGVGDVDIIQIILSGN